MIAGGLLDEVKSLKEKGYTSDLKALNTVGYKELFSYLEGELDISAAIEMIKLNTRHYAKRQITLFGKDEEIIWLDAGEEDLTDRILEYFIKTDI